MSFKHGMRRTRLHNIWVAMRQRCSGSDSDQYKHYTEKGIKVCDEWSEFIPFYEWAMANGYRDDLTLDRKDNDKGYCPENCRWADRIVQANNTGRNHSISFNGETLTLAQWSRKTGIRAGTIRDRIKKLNWSVEKALTTPVKER